jgi:aspartyl-tRNA(Asn)/glutamyl-tRNA(Gln) amidotransferase subunit A
MRSRNSMPPGDADLAFLPLTALSRLVEKHEVSPVEIVSALLPRIERYNEDLRSFITICGDSALAAARAAERDIVHGRRLGPLHGLPVAHKDISVTKGVRTTAHSRTLLEFVPDHDATHVRRLSEAGMILLGKTNTTEFACGALDVFGPHRNPWDLSRYAGGSSGGSANALAAGLAVAATGSDTGGSIRVPASFCGIVGVKPTYGRVSRYGVIPLSWSMDTAGPMARTVADCAMLLGVMAGHDPLDPTSANVSVPDYGEGLTSGIRGLRLGIPQQHFFEGLDPEVDERVRTALRQFETLGASLEPVDLPRARDVAPAQAVLTMVEAFAEHASRLRRAASAYGLRTRRRIASGAFFTTADYDAAVQVRTLWRRELEAVLRHVDALVTPTVPLPAFTVEAQLAEAGPPDTGWLTRHFNFSGHPALTLPCGTTSAGLPVGLQLAGRPFDEATLFRIAHAYEQATPWHTWRPAMREVV